MDEYRFGRLDDDRCYCIIAMSYAVFGVPVLSADHNVAFLVEDHNHGDHLGLWLLLPMEGLALDLKSMFS